MSTLPPARPGTADRRRAPGSSPSRLRRVGAAVAGLALAAAAVALQAAAEKREDRGAPLTWTGGVGEEVASSRFTVKVKAVHGAKSIEIAQLSGDPEKATTSGIFVVVELAATSPRDPQRFGPPVLLSGDDKRYTATEKVKPSLTITEPYIQPGWWVDGVAVFDVPASALEGARIVVGLPVEIIGEVYPPEVEIDLGLDEAAARRLVSGAKDVYQMGSKK
ncbi:hypothetical protein [Planobispora takensis]|uniref:hypothetical protein n=1 Tax=Planobispora takensis TaxID=1367882 RepID=UPI001942DC5A|nr:hypothetical protein [Planobispora takensis]